MSEIKKKLPAGMESRAFMEMMKAAREWLADRGRFDIYEERRDF